MMSEEVKEMIEDARNCSTCLEWHKHCKAECCLTIFLDIPPAFLDAAGRFVEFKKAIGFDERWYYRLRGVEYTHGIIRFPKKDCKVINGQVIFFRKCDLLMDDLKCKGHPDKKPIICKALTLETAVREGEYFGTQKFRMTPNCLFRFKTMEGNDEKEKAANGRSEEATAPSASG